HQALSMLPHNLRDDIGFERPCQGIDLCSRRQTILNGGLGRDDGPLLQRRVIDELQKSIVEAKWCTTPRACGEYPPGVNEAIPKRHMGEEGCGSPWRVDDSGELFIRELRAQCPQPIHRRSIA